MIAAAALNGAAPQPPYPAAAVYAAFTEACGPVGDLAKARGMLSAGGWREYAPAPDSKAGKLVAIGTAGLKTLSAGARMRPTHVFRREVAGETLDLILSGVEIDGSWVNGCRVYDFDETRALPPSFVTAAIGRAPTTDTAREAVLSKAEWRPGYRADHMSTEVFFVPAGSPVIDLVGASGICIVAQATGEI